MSGLIRICMGSACHAHGSAEIVRAFQKRLAERGLEDKIRLEGRFCKNQCGQGLNVEVNNVVVGHVTEADVDRLIDAALGGELS
jgi:NADH:ubiquinone oxidoreductase subunit E